jgi:hypothetical protein
MCIAVSVQYAGVLLPSWLADPDWRKRHAALICLAQVRGHVCVLGYVPRLETPWGWHCSEQHYPGNLTAHCHGVPWLANRGRGAGM